VTKGIKIRLLATQTTNSEVTFAAVANGVQIFGAIPQSIGLDTKNYQRIPPHNIKVNHLIPMKRDRERTRQFILCSTAYMQVRNVFLFFLYLLFL